MQNYEKMSLNRTRDRLAYGETNERRQRNDKRNKPPRALKSHAMEGHDPRLNKRVAERKRVLHHETAYATIEIENL